ncbi:MAG: diacylglycerol kinase family protein [Chitinophagales bacterium]
MLKIAFIVHGKCRARKQLLEDIQHNFGSDFMVGIFETTHYQHSIELGKKAAEERYDYIISCGGDGTLNETLNGIMQSANREVKLGVLPHGSGNDFIKTVQSSDTVEGLRKLIDDHRIRRIDIGLSEYISPHREPAKRYFINITDIGLGGVIAEQLFGSKKFFGPTLTYQYYILKNLITYSPKPIIIEADSFNYAGRVMNFCAANAKYFGSGLGVSPQSDISDGLLNAIAVGNIGLLDYFKHLPAIKKCLPIQHPEVKYYTAREIKFSSTIRDMPVDMDGEFIGYLPMKVTVIPAAIDFICMAS